MASLNTEVLQVNIDKILDRQSQDCEHIQRAANELRTSDVPVAFPTETVYGLGADATRSAAVQGIYKAKQRPSDNPLIVHFHSLDQLRRQLRPSAASSSSGTPSSVREVQQTNGSNHHNRDPIPEIYQPLIKAFWPGPLTMIMPNPVGSTLAPEVTAGLPSFGARMPSNKLALALIEAADVPVAAPSANSSSKPSPTTAEHVRHDLNGRISTILDGGACDVGVESTVVNGLTDPPLILRPGGIGIDQLRACPGWEQVQIGYKDNHESGAKPLAPGMKYRHYSPKATVILFEHGKPQPSLEEMAAHGRSLGLIRTQTWKPVLEPFLQDAKLSGTKDITVNDQLDDDLNVGNGVYANAAVVEAKKFSVACDIPEGLLDVWEIHLGASSRDIARGLFSALRELDLEGVTAIFVEGVDDSKGDVAVAVMNRLRKAAEVKVVS